MLAKGVPLVAGHDALCRILHHLQPMPASDRHDGIHLARNTCIVHRHDRPGARVNGRFNQTLIKIQRVLTDIHKHAEQKPWAALIFLAVALFFLANAGLGTYQAGAEWKFWPGPTTCATAQPITGSAGDLLKKLETTTAIRCDEASWRFAGLSFAGWNVVVSLLLFVGCLKAAFAAAPKNR